MNIREIILDTETTGLSPNGGHRIVEIGALEMVNKILTGNKFHFYINPERDMPDEAYRIHGISSDFLKDKPLFKEIAKDFLDFVEGGKLVIHNAPFDIKFLNHELSLVNLPSLELSEAIDTLIIARKAFPGARVNLDALCRRFKVDNTSREFHGALLDAALLAEVYVELTGGRQTSFSMSKKVSNESLNQFVESKVEGNNLVIYPTEEELALHQEFMERIMKK
jgi:DNA polymerase III subunit epsilon